MTRQRRRRRVAECGTDAGYYRHLRRTKTDPCEPCLAAHRAAGRERNARAKRTCELCGYEWIPYSSRDRNARCGSCRDSRGPAVCGTTRAYWRHVSHGESPCDLCKVAYNARRTAIRAGLKPPPEDTGKPERGRSRWSDAELRFNGRWVKNSRGILIPTLSTKPVDSGLVGSGKRANTVRGNAQVKPRYPSPNVLKEAV